MTKEARDKIAGGLQEAAIIAPYLARIAELTAALKPFANVTPVLQEDDHGVIYEWALNCDDIRQARKVLGEK